MNTGTRLTLLQSKGCNRYAIKTGSGWVEDIVINGKVYPRELNKRRLDILIAGYLAIRRDIELQEVPVPVDPFAEDMPF